MQEKTVLMFMKKISLYFLPVFLFITLVPFCAYGKDTYPKLANYYLKYYSNLRPEYFETLKKWDLLITQNDISMANSDFIDEYKTAKPDGIILAYIYSAMATPVPQGLYSEIDRANLWLRDKNGQKLMIWPNVFATNLSKDAWISMNLDYVDKKYREDNWDGIMYDVVDASINHFSKNGIDINGDGTADDQNFVNSSWQKGMTNLFSKTRALFPNKYIVMNGNSLDSYQPATNGRIFENFPTPWEGNGSWQASMYQYLKRLPKLNKNPQIYVINATTNNAGTMSNYKQMRFGLTSALLGEGYYSFDFGDQSHEQLWWYDEYDVALGRSESSYYNLLKNNSDYVEPGLWRRDFENGVAIVNSSGKDQLYIFPREQFEKIRGTQDRNVNDGSKVNYVRLANNDGIIMRRVKQDIVGSVFPNGNFVRVFSNAGQQTRNGFFAYRADSAPNTFVLLDDVDNDGQRDRIADQNGTLVIARYGKATIRLQPYGANFKGKLAFTAYDFNKDGFKEIIVAPASGGGPHVKTFSSSGKLLNAGFFAFDKNFRGGVNLTAGDVNNDGKGEIIVAPLKGMPSTVKFFSEQGKTLSSFLTYDKNFRGGVSVAVGDVDNDGKNELVTGAVSGGPHVRVFDYLGRLKSQFMAYDPKSGTGISVMVNDIEGDGKTEILAATASF